MYSTAERGAVWRQVLAHTVVEVVEFQTGNAGRTHPTHNPSYPGCI